MATWFPVLCLFFVFLFATVGVWFFSFLRDLGGCGKVIERTVAGETDVDGAVRLPSPYPSGLLSKMGG